MKKNVIKDKSLSFAIDIVNLCKELQGQKEFIISKQILRSGTAIGALVREAEQAESTKDFIHKLSIALKEAHGTEYWLELRYKTNYVTKVKDDEMSNKAAELIRLLTSIIKTSKLKLTTK